MSKSLKKVKGKYKLKINPNVSIMVLIIIIILVLEILNTLNKKSKVERNLERNKKISTESININESNKIKEIYEIKRKTPIKLTSISYIDSDEYEKKEVVEAQNSDYELKSETTMAMSEIESQTQNENKGYTIVPRLEDGNPMTLLPNWTTTDMVMRNQVVRSYINALYAYELSSPYLNFDFGSYNLGRKGSLIFLKDLVICGDSYCGFLSNYLKNNTSYENSVFAYAGHTIIENKSLYEKAIDSPYMIVMLSTSVNDVFRGTDLKLFKETMEGFFKRAYEENKIMIVHSQCNFVDDYGIHANENAFFNYPPKAYDEILKRSANKFGNVIYVDCTDIARDEYLRDTLHYNDEFYRQLLDKVESALLSKIG